MRPYTPSLSAWLNLPPSKSSSRSLEFTKRQIIRTGVSLSIHQKRSRIPHRCCQHCQVYIDLAGEWNSKPIGRLVQRRREPVVIIVTTHQFARPQCFAYALELRALACCESVHTAMDRCKVD